MRGKADNRVVRQLPYSFRLTKQKFEAQRYANTKTRPRFWAFVCSPLFQHSLGNTQHGANLGAEERPKKRAWKSALRTVFFASSMDNKWLQGAHLRQVPLKPCGHEPIVSKRESPSLSNAAHPLSSLPPYLSFLPMLPGNQCDHQNNQGCGNLWFVLCPIANLPQQTRQTSISDFWFEYTVHFMH